jgi:hypothetical protein
MCQQREDRKAGFAVTHYVTVENSDYKTWKSQFFPGEILLGSASYPSTHSIYLKLPL